MDNILETETAVTEAVEAVAETLTLNKTVVIAVAATLVGVGGTIAVIKLKDKLSARFAAAKAKIETELATS